MDNGLIAHRLDRGNLRRMFISPLILLVIALICSFFLHDLWSCYNSICHTIVELICIFITLSSFLAVWFTYEKITDVECIILAFGLLCTSVFDIFHTFFYPELKLNPAGYYDLSARYWIIARLCEAFVIFISTSKVISSIRKKWTNIFIVLIITIGLSLLILFYPAMMPVMITTNHGLTLPKILIEYFVVSIFIADIYLIIQGNLFSKNVIAFRYLVTALVLAIFAEISLTLLEDLSSYYHVLGHLLKVICYFYIFRGIFISIISHPYERLEKKNRYINDILNQMPSSLIIFDDMYRLVFANERALKFLGCSFKEVRDQTVKQMAEKYIEDKTVGKIDVDSMLKGTVSVKNILLTIKVNDEKYVKTLLDMYRLENNQLLFQFNEAKVEQKLEDLRFQTQTVLNSMSNFVLLADRDDNIVMCNKAFQDEVGICTENILGMGIKEFFSIAQFEAKTIIQKSESSIIYEGTLVSVKGEEREVIINLSSVFNVEGELIGNVIIGSDITTFKKGLDRHQNQEKLALIGQMVSGIVHEIKNPLTVIKGISQIIHNKYEDLKLQDYVKIIEGASNDINRFIVSILDLAKPHNSEVGKISANSLVDEIRLMVKDYLANKGVDFNINLCQNEESVLGDRNKLKQVILNVINNAVDALENTKNPKLTVKTAFDKLEDCMLISIIDNGKGISKEDIKRIGMPFYTTKPNGTGLGLSICFQIINEHGGRIDIESEPGEGAHFLIHLPVRSLQEYNLENIHKADYAKSEVS